MVLTLILCVLGEFVTTVSHSWRSAASDPFDEAESAFDALTDSLGCATLEPYDDYADPSGTFRSNANAAFTPDHLAQRSDLDFVCGPSTGGDGLLASTGRTTASDSLFFVEPAGETELLAQAGLDRLLNARGYFVEFGADSGTPSFFLGAPRLRWRLKQVAQPSESLQIYASSGSSSWIAQLAGPSAEPATLAENVIALVVLPERAANDAGAPLAPAFSYDSRDSTSASTRAQLPPRVRVMLTAIDESSAQQLAAASGASAPMMVPNGLFQSAAKLDADIATLDSFLTSARIHHRIFQRDLELVASTWENAP